MELENGNEFWNHYKKLCLDCGICPLKSVFKYLKNSNFNCPVELVRSEHWPFLLYALSVDNTLISVQFGSSLTSANEKVFCKKKRRKDLPIPYGKSAKNINDICKCLNRLLNTSEVLRVLKLENLSLHTDDVCLLSAGIKDSKIEHFSLEGCHFGDDSIRLVCSALQLTDVEWVNFSSCNLTETGLASVCKLINRQVGKRGCNLFNDTLRYRIPSLDDMKGLRKLTLNNNQVGDSGLKLILDSLESDLWMKVLELQKCSFGNESAKMVLKFIKYNTSIQIIDLRLNDIDECHIKQMAQQLSINNAGKTLKYSLGPLWKPPNKEVLRYRPRLKLKIVKQCSPKIRKIKHNCCSLSQVPKEKTDSSSQTDLSSEVDKLQAALVLHKSLCHKLLKNEKKHREEIDSLHATLKKLSVLSDFILIDRPTFEDIKETLIRFNHFLNTVNEYGMFDFLVNEQFDLCLKPLMESAKDGLQVLKKKTCENNFTPQKVPQDIHTAVPNPYTPRCDRLAQKELMKQNGVPTQKTCNPPISRSINPATRPSSATSTAKSVANFKEQRILQTPKNRSVACGQCHHGQTKSAILSSKIVAANSMCCSTVQSISVVSSETTTKPEVSIVKSQLKKSDPVCDSILGTKMSAAVAPNCKLGSGSGTAMKSKPVACDSTSDLFHGKKLPANKCKIVVSDCKSTIKAVNNTPCEKSFDKKMPDTLVSTKCKATSCQEANVKPKKMAHDLVSDSSINMKTPATVSTNSKVASISEASATLKNINDSVCNSFHDNKMPTAITTKCKVISGLETAVKSKSIASNLACESIQDKNINDTADTTKCNVTSNHQSKGKSKSVMPDSTFPNTASRSKMKSVPVKSVEIGGTTDSASVPFFLPPSPCSQGDTNVKVKGVNAFVFDKAMVQKVFKKIEETYLSALRDNCGINVPSMPDDFMAERFLGDICKGKYKRVVTCTKHNSSANCNISKNTCSYEIMGKLNEPHLLECSLQKNTKVNKACENSGATNTVKNDSSEVSSGTKPQSISTDLSLKSSRSQKVKSNESLPMSSNNPVNETCSQSSAILKDSRSLSNSSLRSLINPSNVATDYSNSNLLGTLTNKTSSASPSMNSNIPNDKKSPSENLSNSYEGESNSLSLSQCNEIVKKKDNKSGDELSQVSIPQTSSKSTKSYLGSITSEVVTDLQSIDSTSTNSSEKERRKASVKRKASGKLNR